MDYFLDTNIAIGFIFCTDPWHDLSDKIFNDTDRLHYSHNVSKELKIKYDFILREQKQFFYSIHDELKSTLIKFKKISFEDLKEIGLNIHLKYDFDYNKKVNSLIVFWDYCLKKSKVNNKIKISDIVNYINSWIFSFDRFVFSRKLKFERTVICCNQRVEEYPMIFKELNNVSVHDEDAVIILDAHDLACRENYTLDFVSADKKLCTAVKNINSLNINNFIYIKDYTFKN